MPPTPFVRALLVLVAGVLVLTLVNIERVRDVTARALAVGNVGALLPPQLDVEDYDAATVADNVTILMWSKYYGGTADNFIKEVVASNPLPAYCRLTGDRSMVASADAVVFSVIGTDTEEPDFNKMLAMQANATMNYRTDSTASCFAGQLRRKRQSERNAPTTFSINETDFASRRPVAWLVSHCTNANQRLTYGSCGERQCPHKDCYRHLGTKYKFYLAFENSNCDHYVTEKTFYALHHGMVPVVYGGRTRDDHARLIPDEGKIVNDSFLIKYTANAIINVRDFASVKDLVDRLRFLSGNYAEYMKYHAWRRNWVLEKDIGLKGFRRMCELVHRRQVTGNRTRLMDNGRFVDMWRDPQRNCDAKLPIVLN